MDDGQTGSNFRLTRTGQRAHRLGGPAAVRFKTLAILRSLMRERDPLYIVETSQACAIRGRFRHAVSGRYQSRRAPQGVNLA